MIGSAADGSDWQPDLRNKPRREIPAQRFRDPNDPFQIVIVRDIWLTGFDAPGLHTMCADKPMHAGHRTSEPRIQGQTRRAGGWIAWTSRTS